MTVRLSSRAEAQVDALIAHYERLGRLAAARNLLAALEHAGAYWIAYTLTEPAVIQAVIYDTANIPRRL